ncbi:DUF6207 family protein [Streptomyces mirabilis]|uniref:DUF6207 family protein n=1 Tax=Streptomyces mirabilis TaxID=68239 RepID=UPI003320C0B3
MAGFDDDTIFAFQAAIARIWGTSIAERTTRDAGQPGVRLRMYTDLPGPRGGLFAGADAVGHVDRRGPPPRGGVTDHACVHGATPVPGARSAVKLPQKKATSSEWGGVRCGPAAERGRRPRPRGIGPRRRIGVAAGRAVQSRRRTPTTLPRICAWSPGMGS